MSRISSLCLLLGLTVATAFAQDAPVTVTTTTDQPAEAAQQVTQNLGARVINGVSFLPVRVLGDWLGATRTFDAATETVTMAIPARNIDAKFIKPNMLLAPAPRILPAKTVTLKLGTTSMTVDGAPVTLPAPITIFGNAGYVPGQAFINALNQDTSLQLSIAWVGEKKLVVVMQPEGLVHRRLAFNAEITSVSTAVITSGKVNTNPIKK